MKEGRVRATLSGRSLIAVLIALWDTRATATALQADRALATTLYDRIAAELTTVTHSGQPFRVTLDDGPRQHAGTTGEPPAAPTAA